MIDADGREGGLLEGSVRGEDSSWIEDRAVGLSSLLPTPAISIHIHTTHTGPTTGSLLALCRLPFLGGHRLNWALV